MKDKTPPAVPAQVEGTEMDVDIQAHDLNANNVDGVARGLRPQLDDIIALERELQDLDDVDNECL